MNIKTRELFFLILVKLTIFYLTLFLGIICAVRLATIFEYQNVELPSISLFNFLFTFFIATVLLIALITIIKKRTVKGKILKVLFGSISLFGSLMFFNAFLPAMFSLILVLFLGLWWIKKPTVLNQDILMVFAFSGIGAQLGLSLDYRVVILILIVLSIYDFIAVYKTKHMVKMAKEMIEVGTIPGFVFPFQTSGFLKSTAEVKPGEGKFLILGGGDIILPLMFSVSLLEFGVLTSFLVSIFSLIGVLFNFLLLFLQKERKPIPALPLISLFSITGYFFIKLFD